MALVLPGTPASHFRVPELSPGCFDFHPTSYSRILGKHQKMVQMSGFLLLMTDSDGILVSWHQHDQTFAVWGIWGVKQGRLSRNNFQEIKIKKN